MLLYVTLTVWTGWVIYFWVSILSLCVAPFLFNPHQFSFTDFIIDYRYVLRGSLIRVHKSDSFSQGVPSMDEPR